MVTNEGTKWPKSKSKNYSQRFDSAFVELTHYTESTTIHGIKYLGQKQRPCIEKMYWIIIFIVCFTFMGFFIRDILTKWSQKFIIVVEDDKPTPIYKIPFPAITICPEIKIKTQHFTYDRFEELNRDRHTNASARNKYYKKFDVAQQICHDRIKMDFEYITRPNYLTESQVDLMRQIAPTMEEVIDDSEVPKSCPFHNSTGLDNFSEILTNEGVCFTFNLPSEILKTENIHLEYPYHNITSTINGWSYESGYSSNSKFPYRTCSAGQGSSVVLSLQSKKSDMNSLCQPTNVGFKIILHSPTIYPTTFETFISINHESLNRIVIEPKIITTSENLRSFPPEDRQCYFNDERNLQFFKFYNRINCKLECFANYTLKHYKCVHFAFPRQAGVPICGSNLKFLHIYEKVDSFDTLINYLTDFPDDHAFLEIDDSLQNYSDTCDCLPACNSIEYKTTHFVENFKYEKLQKELGKIFNNSDSYNENVPTGVLIYWKETVFVGMTRKQLYTFSDLVSNFGGLVGLFMGASILSVFEIVYFCFLRQITKCNVKLME